MFHLLYKYFVLHQQVIIPGIGVFVLEKEPATIDEVQRVIHAPAQVVKFKPLGVQADNSFYVYLATELKIEVLDAIKKYHDFASRLKQEVQDKKWVELPNLGILTPGVRDEIKFKSVPVLKAYYPDTVVENLSNVAATSGVTVVDPEESVSAALEGEKEFDRTFKKKRDYWWLYALALTLIAVGAIGYYYYRHGSLLH